MSPLNFIDPTANLGSGTRVWHYTVILAHVKIGNLCNIGSHVEIGSWTTIGDKTRIGKGTFLPSCSNIGTNVFIGPGVIFCDDKYPRANNANYRAEPPTIGNNASIGAGAVILPGIHIGEGALIGAGAVVTESVDPHTVVYGNPARCFDSSFQAQGETLEHPQVTL